MAAAKEWPGAFRLRNMELRRSVLIEQFTVAPATSSRGWMLAIIARSSARQRVETKAGGTSVPPGVLLLLLFLCFLFWSLPLLRGLGSLLCLLNLPFGLKLLDLTATNSAKSERRVPSVSQLVPCQPSVSLFFCNFFLAGQCRQQRTHMERSFRLNAVQKSKHKRL